MADAREVRAPLAGGHGDGPARPPLWREILWPLAGLRAGAAVAPAHGHGHGHEDHHASCIPGCHGHGPLSRDKALTHPSLSFEPVFNEKYNEDRNFEVSRLWTVVTRVMPLLIGILTAGAAVMVGFISETIGEWRCDLVRSMIIDGKGWGSAWVAMFGTMLVCALLAGLPVYCGSETKTCGSSGIPQLVGLLNGVDLTHEFSGKHLLAKWWGVSFAVSSGLAVGPEGPMIFIGSAVGAFLAHMIVSNKRVWECVGHPPATVAPNVFLRDYASIGAGCGIAAAFRAPIAGTLFIVEEAASHFKKEQMALIFFGGLASLEVILLTGGFGSVLEYKVQTGPTCSSTPWWAMIFFVFLGGACGVMGALFNWMNLRIMTFRANHCNPTKPIRRVKEIIFLVALTSSCWIGSVMLFSEHGETPSSSQHIMTSSNMCVKDQWINQVIDGSIIEKKAEHEQGYSYMAKMLPKGCLYGAQYNSTLCPKAWAAANKSSPNAYAQKCIAAINMGKVASLSNKESYCCAFDSIDDLLKGRMITPANAGCDIDLGENTPSLEKGKDGNLLGEENRASFNSMASLVLVPFKVACQNLFARGVPELLDLGSILVYFVLFTSLCALTAGCAMPSGLLMPQMVIGGCIGRALTLIILRMQTGLHTHPYAPDASFMWSSVYEPLFGKDGPLGLALLTPDTAGYLDPGIGALVGAAALIGGSGRVTLFTTVMMVEITGDPVMIFPVGFATVFAVIVGNLINHGIYHSLLDIQSQPFLPDSWDDEALPPRILVKDMMPRNDPIVVPVNGGKRGIDAAIGGNNYTGFPLVDEQGAVIGMSERPGLEELLNQDDEVTPDQLKYCSDMYPVTVRKEFPLQMAYVLFKSMDMRNLVVVDDHHKPLAVMTRFAFLAWRVKDRLADQIPRLWQDEENRRRNRRARVVSDGAVSMQENAA